jgi:hypothetical protein
VGLSTNGGLVGRGATAHTWLSFYVQSHGSDGATARVTRLGQFSLLGQLLLWVYTKLLTTIFTIQLKWTKNDWAAFRVIVSQTRLGHPGYGHFRGLPEKYDFRGKTVRITIPLILYTL